MFGTPAYMTQQAMMTRSRLQHQLLANKLNEARRQGGGILGRFGGRGGRGNSQMDKLIEQLMASSQSANEANEARYKEGLGLLNQLGVAGQEDIRRGASRQVAESGQNLASRGLSGTTIGQGNANQIQANAQFNTQKLWESVASRKAGFIERRTDRGPDMAMIAQLIQQNQSNSSW